jgi:hypothetical protein
MTLNIFKFEKNEKCDRNKPKAWYLLNPLIGMLYYFVQNLLSKEESPEMDFLLTRYRCGRK